MRLLMCVVAVVAACGSDSVPGPMPTNAFSALTGDQVALVRIIDTSGTEVPIDVPPGATVYAYVGAPFVSKGVGAGFPCEVDSTWTSYAADRELLICDSSGMGCTSRSVKMRMQVVCSNGCATVDNLFSCVGSISGLPDLWLTYPKTAAETTCISMCPGPMMCQSPLGCQ
jgi:hypothetical protein